MANCGKHYHCTHNFKGLTSTIALAILFGASTVVQIVGGIIAGSAIPGLGILTAMLFIAAIFELCDFLEGRKSICIVDNVCVIGRIVELIPVGADKSGFEKMDDDFTFNIVLSPHSSEESKSNVIASDPHQGKYIDEQNESRDAGVVYKGEDVKFANIDDRTEVLHCEVKGCRVHDVCIALKAISFAGLGVAIFCSIPIIGWVACAIVAAVVAAIAVAVVAIVWSAAHNGDINDVYDPASGVLRAADKDTGKGGDIILVKGDWCADAGHGDCWNEIHPVRFVQKLTDEVATKYNGDNKADSVLVEDFKKDVLDVWCFHVKEADDPAVRDAQDQPENDWDVHPEIDGCREPIIIE